MVCTGVGNGIMQDLNEGNSYNYFPCLTCRIGKTDFLRFSFNLAN